MADEEKYDEYNDEPVKYCKRCYSLKVQYEESYDSEYCGSCGCSDIAETSIEEWEKLYENRYHKKFVNVGIDLKNTPLFKSSCKELRKILSKMEDWKNVIKAVYPRFPVGMRKEDAIFLLFDKLIKDNRLEDLKHVLFKYQKDLRYGREERS